MAKSYQAIQIIDGLPTFKVPLNEILEQVEHGGAIRIMTPLEYHTDRQRRWYRGICLPWLVEHDENKESVAWWDQEVKRLCDGLNLLKKEVFIIESIDGQKIPIGRLSIKDVGKRNMTAFIEEILAMSVTMNWGISPPDKDLRRK
jgi:hypothetical protein